MLLNNSLHFPRLTRRTAYSSFSDYREYRQEIREDCLGRCVYCDVHENELARLGASETMTLDHFRPQSRFPALSHIPSNLVLACETCNHLKGNDWPAGTSSRTVAGEAGYIDPFAEDRNEYFEVLDDGRLRALKPPAEYMKRVLVLDRQLPRLIRHYRILAYQNVQLLAETFDRDIRQIDEILKSEALAEEDWAAWLAERKRIEERKLVEITAAIPALGLDFEVR